jgi:copper chaperone CopZ
LIFTWNYRSEFIAKIRAFPARTNEASPGPGIGEFSNFPEQSRFKMKKIFLLIAPALLTVQWSFAQVVRKGGIEIATIKTPTVQCEECKQRLENYVSREEGVQKVVADWRKKITKVTYVVERTNYENVKTAIANAGFDADDVTANPESYQKLPRCCKKPEDGGGPPKKN